MDALSPGAEVLERPALNPLTQRLLHAPIVPLILRLAWPNMLIALAQAGAALIDTWWLAKLGNDVLAGMALVFPFVMLVGTISGGSIGAGISAAVARALGARQQEHASAILLHGLIINVAVGAALSAVMLLFGPQIYRASGGEGHALQAALLYSNVVFAGNVMFWAMNALMSVVRGTGNMMVPALVSCGGVLVMVPLSPCLIFGLGPFPELGIAGSAVSLLAYYLAGTAVLVWYILAGRCIVPFRWTPLRLHTFIAILAIGAVGTITSILINLTASANNALVSVLAGAGGVAGYGTAARLEYLLIPIAFGLGTPLVAMVGTSVGAGDRARALRIVLAGGAIAFGITEAVGLCAAIFPEAWLHLFTRDATAVAVGSRYLHIAGPLFGFFGFGIGMYFALLGAGQLFWPIVGSVLRSVLALAGGAFAVFVLGSLTAMFAFIAAAFVVSGVVPLLALRKANWR
ncbi:multidrug transporter MatE [Afipia sp. P52-10]|jgi:Na+-driven multidrug efflux pump|uniref:MATE family efflux transporter n=1 Tax=Afipia sp. P52-10 TaxID=1429916 RepID=UPI0003DF4442|nr:MATE family efflux transporter [Afipia sp. P52-10]ETR78372.1 multidrug transporter MatE [Afipia sp. P52-10]